LIQYKQIRQRGWGADCPVPARARPRS